MPPLWPCTWADCQFPAVQRAGDCVLCNSHLCRTHLRDDWHNCPKPDTNWDEYSARYAASESQRLAQLCRRIDGEQLCLRASEKRGDGIPRTIDLTTKVLSAMMGGQNCHAEIVFADGVVWLARFRVPSVISPPVQVRDDVLRSEAASMAFLQRHMAPQIPSPRVYDWACEVDPGNKVGVGYILMEKMPGRPLDWQAATAEQREKVVRQFADIMLEIEKNPFDKFGSLEGADEAEFKIQGLADHSTARAGERGRPLGPFGTSRDASGARVDAYLEMIAAGEIGTASNAVDVFLVHRFRLDVLEDLYNDEEDPSKERFYLKHMDDKGDHILVNDDFDIVGVIDWEWCSVVSKAEAFSSPCMMWPVAAFYDGSNELSPEEVLLAKVFREKGREDLARCVLDGRKVQRFMFAIGPSAAAPAHKDPTTFACLFIGLKRVFDEPGHDDTGMEADEMQKGARNEWDMWRAQALERWKQDASMQAVLQTKE